MADEEKLEKHVLGHFANGLSVSKFFSQNTYQDGAGIDPLGVVSSVSLRGIGEIRAGSSPTDIGSTTVDTNIGDFVAVDISDGANKLYGYSPTKIYQTDIATEIVSTTNYPLAITNGCSHRGIAYYNGKIHYANGSTQVGTFTPDSNPDDNAANTFTGLETEIVNRPMIVGGDKLFIANGIYIASVLTATLTLQDLDLPAGTIIADLEYWRDTLIIGTYKGLSTSGDITAGQVRIYFWDGVSSSWYADFALGDSKIYGLAIYDGTIWALGDTYLYKFNGTTFEPALYLRSLGANIAPTRRFGNLRAFRNCLIWGNTDNEIVFYGHPDTRLNKILCVPLVGNATFLALYGATGKVFASSNNVTDTKKLSVFTGSAGVKTLRTDDFLFDPPIKLVGVKVPFRRGSAHSFSIRLFNHSDGSFTTIASFAGESVLSSKLFFLSKKLILNHFYLLFDLNDGTGSPDAGIKPGVTLYYQQLKDPYLKAN